jgi:quercetin dioxygenase-like cupin family protein
MKPVDRRDGGLAMKRRTAAIGGVVLAFVLAGSALAVGTITVKALGAFGVRNEIGYAAGHTFSAHAAPGSLVLTVEVRVPPGGGFPWHFHTSSLTVTVAQGSLTVQDPDSCDTQAFGAGSGFVEEAGVIHRAFNAGSTIAILYVTYVGIPAGSPPDVFEPASYSPC